MNSQDIVIKAGISFNEVQK